MLHLDVGVVGLLICEEFHTFLAALEVWAILLLLSVSIVLLAHSFLNYDSMIAAIIIPADR